MGAEGLLEPMRYQDTEGAHHYACPYGCPKDLVNFRLIEGMWGHIRQEHGRGHQGFKCEWCLSFTTLNKDGLRSHKKAYCEKYEVAMDM